MYWLFATISVVYKQLLLVAISQHSVLPNSNILCYL